MTTATVAVGAVLAQGTAVATPSPEVSGDVPAYRMARDAQPVSGATSSGEGPLLKGPGTYTDTAVTGQKKYYRVRLDGTSNVYLSAVLAPLPGTEVGVLDGVRISLAKTDGTPCSEGTTLGFLGESARPIADYVSRRIEPGRSCQKAGEYLLEVEGRGRSRTVPQRWPMELTYKAEPPLKPGSAVPTAPTGWSTEPPAPAGGEPRRITGGTGFNDAAAVEGGVWRDEMRPGESRFYRVPVAWGRQLFVNAQLANLPGADRFAAINGFRVELYNPARGLVESKKDNYTGKPASVGFGTAPAAYANRTEGGSEAARAMRFEGWYYVQVSLDRTVPGAVPLTLDISVKGEGGAGPVYDGDAEAAGFALGDEARDAGDPAMKAFGLTGIGLGTALVAGLAAWWLLARRRA
ncbi:hypothetical protein [Streptomyces purpureus]|uniref:Uncharacterized protein n=1 Tax=Streptomyces purpureus TaxID=1951 RepID=A0A918LTU6_9ACTN|nr:hypothetical protein [Streptomyces purpureus]GGT52569.1 hypothetical protein GCM10014713_53070 [Streptomyces purpureus]